MLYGSLAKTGPGHGTDRVIESVLPGAEVICDTRTETPHPNTMDLAAFRGGRKIASMRVYSVGGGAIRIEGREEPARAEVYPLGSFSDIRAYCEEHSLRLSDYVFATEGEGIKEYLSEVWQAMKASIAAGLKATACCRAVWAWREKRAFCIGRSTSTRAPKRGKIAWCAPMPSP